MSESPLRLAVGAHLPGTGFACAMQVLSWEQGDQELSPYPANVAKPLARMVQHVNDTVCAHLTRRLGEPELLCASCSMKVMELGHRTVDTAGMTRRTHWRWVEELLVGEHGILHGAQDLQIRARIREAAEATRMAEGNGKARSQLQTLSTPPLSEARRLTFVGQVHHGLRCSLCHIGGGFADLGAQFVDIDLRGGSIALKSTNLEIKLEAAGHAIDAWETATGVNAPEPDPVALARVAEQMRELAAA